MRFRIDLKIFIIIILFYLTKQIQIYALIMIFALIHELAHLLAGILIKMKPEKLEIMPFGFSIPEKRLLKVGQRFLEWGDRYAVRLPAVRSLV